MKLIRFDIVSVNFFTISMQNNKSQRYFHKLFSQKYLLFSKAIFENVLPWHKLIIWKERFQLKNIWVFLNKITLKEKVLIFSKVDTDQY